MTIMAILGAALFTMFSQSSRTWQRAEARTGQFSAAREMLGMMAMELRQAIVAPRASAGIGAHFYGLPPGDDSFNRTNEDADSGQIYFVAPAETRAEGADQDVCVVGYWVEDDPSGNPPGKKLMRYCLSDDQAGWDTFNPSGGTDGQDMSINVQSLTFEFWGPNDSDWAGTGDSWSSETGPPSQQNALPRAVRIELVVWDPTLDPNADPTDPDVKKRFKTFTTVVRINAAQ